MIAKRPSAGHWERTSAHQWLAWATSEQSARLERLQALKAAVQTVMRWTVGDRPGATAVIEQLRPTLSKCDELDFSSSTQALAYTIWHLTDRYARVISAFDALFSQGHLPLRKTRMSVLEVGAGPAPAIYAAIDYYSDLGRWCSRTGQPYHPLPPTVTATIDRGSAWGRLLHILSEALIPSQADWGPLPFAITYDELRGFSVRREQLEGIELAARRLQAEADRFDEALDIKVARQQALQEGAYPVGAYDLIVMCNFLTTAQITDDFAGEIGDLSRSLTPGGVLLALGSAAPKYEALYGDLENIVRAAGTLRPISVFGAPQRAHVEPDVHAIVAGQIVDGMRHLRVLAPEEFENATPELPRDVRSLDPAKIKFPPFTARAFKRERYAGMTQSA